MTKRVFIFAIAALCLALSGPTLGPSTTHAQEVDESYVDLSIDLEVNNGSWNFIARNNGTATAYGATIDIELGDQVIATRQGVEVVADGFEQASGSTCSSNIPGTTCLSGVFTVGALEPGEEKSFYLVPKLTSGLLCCTARTAYWSVPARAVVKNTVPVELERYKGDNTDTGWIYANGEDSVGNAAEAAVSFELEASVDDLLPEAGDTVKFSLKASMKYDHDYESLYEVKLRLKLSPGMGTATATPPGDTAFAAAAGLTRTWDWDIGTFQSAQPLELEVSTTLDDPLPSGVALSDLCLTAELTARPDNNRKGVQSAEICFKEDPIVLLQTGETGLHSLYDCVGSSDYPCSSADTLELLVNGGTAAAASGIVRENPILRPEKVVIQVPDPGGRVSDGSSLTWQTISDDGVTSYRNPFCSDVEEGVLLSENWDSILAAGVDGTGVSTIWGNAADKVTATGVDGGAKPGSLAIKNITCTFEFLNADAGDFISPIPVGGASGFGTTNVVYIFGELGTYFTERSYRATHNNNTPATADDVEYTATGSYIFHVGPVAELEVRDSGPQDGLASTQQTFTILAVNNGPDAAPAARVTVTGLNVGSYVSHTATAGSFDPETGVWTIGELGDDSGYYRATGHPLGWPALTIITSAASARDITAAISNTRDYTVCIDSSAEDVAAASESACTATSGNTWHTAAYYDYIPGNNTATIRARGGTGAAHPEATINLRVLETRVGNILLWQRVDAVSGRRVTHYEVQRWASPWVTLSYDVRGAVYVDLDGRAGADYRVRAVNDRGHEGPWSITGRPPDMPGSFNVALSEGGNAAVLTWTEPASPSPITGYVIDIADTSDGDGRTNDRSVGGGVTTWTHTGLSGGDVKFYRVQARNRDGVGRWTEWQSVGSGPGAPGSLRARANGPHEIVLTWSDASSRDVAIFQYEIEYSDTSASEGYVWLALTAVEGLRHVDQSLTPGETRYYRVRATTLDTQFGNGAWSNVASATTSEAGPAPPSSVAAEADGENRIRVTWDASEDTSSYNIEHSTDGATWEQERTRHTGTCSVNGQTVPCYTDGGLLSGTEHWYRVAGVNRSGVAGQWSGPVFAITDGDPTEPPGEPQNLRITSASGRQVSLAWDAPLDDGGSRVTGYEYMAESACVHDPSYICQVIKPTRTGGTSVTVTVPDVRGQYEFSVRALSAAGAGWWTQPVRQYVNPQRTWRVTLSPSSLTVDEGGEATYRVRLTSDPGQPVMLALHWEGDPDLGNTLSYQQFKWLLPSNYENPDIYLDPEWTAAWNAGVTITVTADEDADSDNGTAEIHNTVYYVPCAELGNPSGCVDDPDDTGITAYITVTERDSD